MRIGIIYNTKLTLVYLRIVKRNQGKLMAKILLKIFLINMEFSLKKYKSSD